MVLIFWIDCDCHAMPNDWKRPDKESVYRATIATQPWGSLCPIHWLEYSEQGYLACEQ